MGFKLQLKPCVGGKDGTRGALQYICKDFSEPNFEAIDGDGRTHVDNVEYFAALGKEYIHSHGGELGTLTFLRWDQLFTKAYTQTTDRLSELSDMRFGDWILRGIQSKSYAIDRSVIIPSKGQTLCPDRVARLHTTYVTPERATERDLYTILFGTTDSRGNLRRNFVAPDAAGTVDRELVNDANMFNPRYRGLSLADAHDNWAQNPEPNKGGECPLDSIQDSDLLNQDPGTQIWSHGTLAMGSYRKRWEKHIGIAHSGSSSRAPSQRASRRRLACRISIYCRARSWTQSGYIRHPSLLL